MSSGNFPSDPLGKLPEIRGLQALMVVDENGTLRHQIDLRGQWKDAMDALSSFVTNLFLAFDRQNLPLEQISVEFEGASVVASHSDEATIIAIADPDVNVPFLQRTLTVALGNSSGDGSFLYEEAAETGGTEESGIPADNKAIRVWKDYVNGEGWPENATFQLEFWQVFEDFLAGELGAEEYVRRLNGAFEELKATPRNLNIDQFNELVEILSGSLSPEFRQIGFREECHHLLLNFEHQQENTG